MNSNVLTNKNIMDILESIAIENCSTKNIYNDAFPPMIKARIIADYLNEVCYKWMGGDWGLKPEDLLKKDKK